MRRLLKRPGLHLIEGDREWAHREGRQLTSVALGSRTCDGGVWGCCLIGCIELDTIRRLSSSSSMYKVTQQKPTEAKTTGNTRRIKVF